MPQNSVSVRSGATALDVYAPGHLAELSEIIDPELVDAVLEDTGVRQQRLRLLPAARRHVLRAGPSPSSGDPPARRYGPSSGRDWAACPWPTHAPRRRLDIWTHRCPCWPTPTTTHSTSFRPSRTPGPASYRAPPANGARPCDADSHPADDLLPLYHRRRQAETRYFSLKSTILDGRVLRSSSVPGLE